MKRLTVLTGVLLMLATTVSADKGENNLYFGMSYAMIAGPDHTKDLLGGGIGFKGGIGFGLNPQTELIVNVQYIRLPMKHDGFLDMIEADPDLFFNVPRSMISMSGGDIQAYGVLVDLKYTFPSADPATTVHSYLIGGLGLFHSEAPDDVTLSAQGYDDWVLRSSEMDTSSTDLSASLGVGIDIEMSNSASFILEGRYMLVFDDDKDSDGNTRLFNIGGAVRFQLGK